AYLFLPQIGSILTKYGFGAGRHPPRVVSRFAQFFDPAAALLFTVKFSSKAEMLATKRQLILSKLLPFYPTLNLEFLLNKYRVLTQLTG
ncbi:hypothetical protein QUA54_21695, partial [Microcoleus sp. MOSTC5]|uniref:hypothetical protein n=1 Tax=Microcoleus sp. MOSTC5 TaxID=3055378 RepID=UPI002FCF036C